MYGVNFEHMPELKSLYGYPATVIATLGDCVFLWQRLKRAGWLRTLAVCSESNSLVCVIV